MPIKSPHPDVGSWYSPKRTIEDTTFDEEGIVVSLDESPDLESWRPFSVSVHQLGSEGGSCIMSIHTFQSEEGARAYYENELESHHWRYNHVGN